MDYLKWNNKIAANFFNEEMEDREVHLYISKSDIIEIGKSMLDDLIEEEIWADYIKALKNGWNGKVDGSNILRTLLWIYEYYKNQKSSKSFEYPPYLGYLVIFIIPLADEKQINFSSYYALINNFLTTNSLPELQSQTKDSNWNALWEDLEHWSIYEKNCELGYFEIHQFLNPNWVYVSKPLSQCFFKPSSLKKIPSLLFQNNFLPYQHLSYEQMSKFLITNSKNLELSEQLKSAIKKNDDTGKILTLIFRKIYDNWKGEEISFTKKEIRQDVRQQPWILAVFKLGIEINFNEEKINWFLRLFSNNEFPDELIFDNNIIIESGRKNWSDKIKLDVSDLILKKEKSVFEDINNKWRGVFNYKDIYFLTSGTNHLLNGWIETDKIFKDEEVYIVCNDEGKKKLKEYFNNAFENYLRNFDYDGLNGHYLYKIQKNLTDDFLANFSVTIPNGPFLQFNNLLKLNSQDYLIDTNPSITIKNIPEKQSISLKYQDYDEEVKIIEKEPYTYLFPVSIKYDTNIQLEYSKQTMRFKEPFLNKKFMFEIPLRNAWSEITDNSEEFLWQGNKLKQTLPLDIFYRQAINHFKSEHNPSISPIIKLNLKENIFYDENKDIMISFLSSAGKLSFEKYFFAFEQILLTHNQNGVIKNFNYSKYLSLRFLESLGHIDVDYLNQRILVNKPQIILIPNNYFKGRIAILIGARSPELILRLIKLSKDLKIKAKIESSLSSENGLQYIIPQVIKLSVQGEENDNYGEKKIKKLADQLKIDFQSELIQPMLLISSSKINDYVNKLIKVENDDFEWARHVFNPKSLKFETLKEFNKELCLLKYQFTNYNIRYRLWLDNKCYVDSNNKNEGIDPLWGRYFILHKLNKNVLLFNKPERKLLVPITIPLPRLINKALTLMSGYIPHQEKHDNITYDVYSNLIPSLTENIFFQLLGQNLYED
ncbi:MAG TPA: hypothetical protein VFF33_13395 [Ignavibacteriaceae bacterium]|nr:hypothetical protein [Ignavibacteriaceae bacterium]